VAIDISNAPEANMADISTTTTQSNSPAPSIGAFFQRLMRLRRHSEKLKALGLTAAMLAASSGGGAVAQTHTEQGKGAALTASRLFHETCFALLPDTEAIARLAEQRQWEPVTGPALRALAPREKPEVIKAWRAKLESETFTLSTTQSRVDPDVEREIPIFAGGKSFHCSIVLNGTSLPQQDAQLMATLVGRPPDASHDAGRRRTHTWAGQNESTLVFIHHMQVLSAGKLIPGGLLSVSITQRKQP